MFHRKSCPKVVGLTLLGFLVSLTAFADTDSETLQTKEGNPLKVIVREHFALFEKPEYRSLTTVSAKAFVKGGRWR